MPQGQDPIPGPITLSLKCAGCQYDLAGLPWGAPCPECGYRAPTTYPTTALREAHPRFIRSTRNQLFGLIIADAIIIAGLACFAVAYLVAILLFPMSDNAAAWVLYLLGLVAIALGLLLTLILAGMIGKRHPNTRPDLDQPKRKGFAKAFWWCVGPFGGALILALATGGATSCLLLIAIPISIASAGVLAFSLFEHNTSVISRCRTDPSWTLTHNLLGYGSILAFVLFAIAIPVLVQATVPFMLTGCAMLVLTHALRTRMAERSVRRVLAEIHDPPTET